MVTQAEFDALKATVARHEAEANTFYLMWAGALVFLMQCGFAMLSAGSIRAKNVKNILLKNLLDACVGGLLWYLVGYGVAYGGDAGFMGTNGEKFVFAGVYDWHWLYGTDAGSAEDNGAEYIGWFFQYTFAAAAATIVSGAVAERCQLVAYLIYTSLITGFIYPVVVHWVWDGAGWLSAANPNAAGSGCIDFAGSGVVHMTGGIAALVGAWILGPRLGRFDYPDEFQAHSTPLVVLGTFILWFGWYGFNPGSTLAIHGNARTMARAAVTTTLSAAAGGVSGLIIKRVFPAKFGGSGQFDIGHTCNSLLGGLVGITAGCATVHVYAAVVIGIVSAFVYHLASCQMRRRKIDDPLDAFAVHGACGIWGVIAVGLFTEKAWSYAPPDSHIHRRFAMVNGVNTDLGPDAGIFMQGTRGILFGTQLLAIVCEIAWVGGMSFIMFFLLKKLGMLRVSHDDEQLGADVSKHGGKAYPDQSETKTQAVASA